MKKYILPVVGLIILGAIIYSLQPKSQSFGTTGGDLAVACNATTVSVVSVGNHSSVEVLATSSRRAWAIVSQPINATNTVVVNINQDALATLTNGFPLAATSSIVLGLNTPLPYTGSISAITNTGSSTVLVTQCTY